MKKTLKTLVASTVLVAVSGSVFADMRLYTDSDSTTIDVKADIPEMVSISKPSDMALMNFTGAGNLTATSNFCIASNLENDKVQLTVTSNIEGTDFALAQGGKTDASDHRALPMEVSYKSTKGGKKVLTKGGKIEVDGAQWLAECQKAPNTGSSITVDIAEANAQNVYAGNYSATLTVTVSTK